MSGGNELDGLSEAGLDESPYRSCARMFRFLSVWLLVVLLAPVAAARDYRVNRRIIYAEYEGKKCRMTLYLPKGDSEAPRPAVLLVHGGAWFFGTRQQLGWYGKRLAERGWIAASINYRMMPKYPFPNCLEDCKAALRWLRAHADDYGIDPNRIGALGNSAGGHLVSLLATTRPEDGFEGTGNPEESSAVQAVVSMYGVADLSYYRSPKGYVRFGGFTKYFMEQFVDDAPEGVPDPYDWASPATYVHAGMPPMLLLHGTKDHWVPYAQSVAFEKQLQRNGVETALITVPHGHAFDFFHPCVRKRVWEDMFGFLERSLGRGPGGVFSTPDQGE